MTSRPSTLSPRRKRARSGGFSLIETMVVVTIIGIMAASVMPAMTEMMANTRQSSAATAILVLARNARREALLGGKYAYAMIFQGANNGGAVQVVTGITSYCNRGTNVQYGPDPVTAITPPRGWQFALGSVNLRSYNLAVHQLVASAEMPLGTSTNYLRICYAVNGETHVSVGANVLPVPQTQTAIMFVRREVSRRARGVERQIVFPPGGTARTR